MAESSRLVGPDSREEVTPPWPVPVAATHLDGAFRQERVGRAEAREAGAVPTTGSIKLLPANGEGEMATTSTDFGDGRDRGGRARSRGHAA